MLTSDQTRHVMHARKHVSIFISHCEQDNDEAKYYEAHFNKSGFTAFQYGHGLRISEQIKITIEEKINNCQFFVFIVSDYSLESEWVQRELGLAISLQGRNKTKKPVIIPVFAEESVWRRAGRRPKAFPTRDFETGKKGKPFGLSAIRCFDKHSSPHADSDEELNSLMRPTILVSRLDFHDEATFYETEVFSLYTQLFPPIEQDDPEDILQWVLHSDVGKERTFYLPEKIAYRLDSRYFILVLAAKAIGLGFFTYDYTTKLLYGNYIAVHECWRSGDVADAFVAEAIDILEELFPEYQGIVFEVEKYDPLRIEKIIKYLEDLKEVTTNLDGCKAFRSKEDSDEIRRFLRVCWYQKICCRFFSSEETEEPISYTAPCLDPRKDPVNWVHMEEDYWLMWLPRNGLDVADRKSLFERAIQCIYVEILGKSLVETYPERGVKYWEYIRKNVERAFESIEGKDIILSTYHYKRSELFHRWFRLGIKISI